LDRPASEPIAPTSVRTLGPTSVRPPGPPPSPTQTRCPVS